jgi:hypothetical protein
VAAVVQGFKLRIPWLPIIEEHLCNLGGQKSQTQEATDVGVIDLLGSSQIAD